VFVRILMHLLGMFARLHGGRVTTLSLLILQENDAADSYLVGWDFLQTGGMQFVGADLAALFVWHRATPHRRLQALNEREQH
jgi:hypothetical protein